MFDETYKDQKKKKPPLYQALIIIAYSTVIRKNKPEISTLQTRYSFHQEKRSVHFATALRT